MTQQNNRRVAAVYLLLFWVIKLFFTVRFDLCIFDIMLITAKGVNMNRMVCF